MLGGYRVNSRAAYGVELALLASVILAGSSIPRAIKSGKPLPIGLSILATYELCEAATKEKGVRRAKNRILSYHVHKQILTGCKMESQAPMFTLELLTLHKQSHQTMQPAVPPKYRRLLVYLE
jgi:hypothetical protein